MNSNGKSHLVQLLADSEDSEHLDPEMEDVSTIVSALHKVYHFKCANAPYSAALKVVVVCMLVHS